MLSGVADQARHPEQQSATGRSDENSLRLRRDKEEERSRPLVDRFPFEASDPNRHHEQEHNYVANGEASGFKTTDGCHPPPVDLGPANHCG
jgi:hypothetical protein